MQPRSGNCQALTQPQSLLISTHLRTFSREIAPESNTKLDGIIRVGLSQRGIRASRIVSACVRAAAWASGAALDDHGHLLWRCCFSIAVRHRRAIDHLHMRRLHTGFRPYACDVQGCGQKFSRSDNMKVHRRNHTGETPFACDECGKAFSIKGNMIVHKMIHANDKAFECSICQKR